MRRLPTYLISTAVLIIAGCSSSNDSGTTTDHPSLQANLEVINAGPITQLGSVRANYVILVTVVPVEVGPSEDAMETDVPDNRKVQIITGFAQFDRDVRNYLAKDFPTTEKCIVSLRDEQPETDPEVAEIERNAKGISAGEAIVISSADGTFATLVSQLTPQNQVAYTAYSGTPPLPADLTGDIPGDTFPAFANVAIPSVPSVENFALSSEELTESTVFTWTASSNPYTRIGITMAIDQLTDNARYIDCDLADDGNFQLPSQTIDEVGMFSDGIVASARRYSTKLHRSGDSMLGLFNSVPIDLP